MFREGVSKEIRRVSIDESGPYWATHGNLGILKNHIHYFERLAESEVRNSPNDYASCQNFAAWLRFQTELITNLIYWQLFLHIGKNWDRIANYTYRTVITELRKSFQEEGSDAKELEGLIHKIKIVIELRSCFVHGGIPNIMRKIGARAGFGDIKTEEVEQLVEPVNFSETKIFFEKLYGKIKKSLPPPSVEIHAGFS